MGSELWRSDGYGAANSWKNMTDSLPGKSLRTCQAQPQMLLLSPLKGSSCMLACLSPPKATAATGSWGPPSCTTPSVPHTRSCTANFRLPQHMHSLSSPDLTLPSAGLIEPTDSSGSPWLTGTYQLHRPFCQVIQIVPRPGPNLQVSPLKGICCMQGSLHLQTAMVATGSRGPISCIIPSVQRTRFCCRAPGVRTGCPTTLAATGRLSMALVSTHAHVSLRVWSMRIELSD